MTKSPKEKEQVALMIRPAQLPAATKALIQVATPTEFIKTRPGKGGKQFTYIEGGYVIARLNQIFSPVGWDFEVINERVEITEVIIRGKLTIKDHKNGFTISKTQYGTRERNAGVPLGDTFKAASTDCLKKCASLFGIGLDIYWQQLDEDKLIAGTKTKPADAKHEAKCIEGNVVKPAKVVPQTTKELVGLSIDKIQSENDATILAQYRVKIGQSDRYSPNQKSMLFGIIDGKIEKYGKAK